MFRSETRRTNYLAALLVIALLVAAAAVSRAGLVNGGLGAGSAHQRYSVINLGTLGGTASLAEGINNRDWATGYSTLPGDTTLRATLWTRGRTIDLGTLGGPNSTVGFPIKDDRGEIAGLAETNKLDPLGENFCGFGTSFTCLGFVWRNGAMSPLPTLGGNNAYALGVNNRGKVVGLAENSAHDPSCIPPQVLDWEAVIWEPESGHIRELPPFVRDSVATALAINEPGQVVGASGFCGPVSSTVLVHAVLWNNGSPINLGSLGGKMNNAATAINSRGQIVGASDLPGDTTGHAFLWQRGVMTDLGTLPGDISSTAVGINDKGQIAGTSCDERGNCRAFLWQDGVMRDLNSLVSTSSSLLLIHGSDINDRGEIVGQAYDSSTGTTPAFVAIPNDGSAMRASSNSSRSVILPERVRKMLRQQWGFARLIPGPMRLR